MKKHKLLGNDTHEYYLKASEVRDRLVERLRELEKTAYCQHEETNFDHDHEHFYCMNCGLTFDEDPIIEWDDIVETIEESQDGGLARTEYRGGGYTDIIGGFDHDAAVEAVENKYGKFISHRIAARRSPHD